MLCRSPIKLKLDTSSKYKVATVGGLGIASVPCGQCLNCRINQSRIWASRILLENTMHEDSIFTTLTYSDERLPDPPHVNKKHLQNFFKKLRYYSEKKFRYFAVGEYGDTTFRPHYHAIIFGLSVLDDESVRRSWNYCDRDIGIHIGEVNKDSARYITGYVTKKIKKVKKEHPIDFGKKDEFMLSSRKDGGIGKPAIDKIAKTLKENEFWQGQLRTIRVACRKQPIGRYLTRKFQDEYGVDEREHIVHFWANQNLHFSDCSPVEDKRSERIIRGKRKI